MKKIFVAVAMLCLAAACNNSRVFYCESNDNRISYSSEAEMDTLSYAMGMNLGLGINIQNANLELDMDAVAAAIDRELGMQVIESERLAENAALMERFNNELMRPYMMAKRMNKELPEVFTEEFTKERVTEILGCDMAKYLRETLAPINTYWMFRAMEDSKGISDMKEIDQKMAITQQDMSMALAIYFRQELPAYQKERSEAWLAMVSERSGVEAATKGDNTFYYRINAAGSELRPVSMRDSVTFRFELYSRRGTLVESTEQRANDILKRIEQVKEDESLDEAKREERIAKLESAYTSTKEPKIPLGQFMLGGAKDALQLIGEGGHITVWLPAELAYGDRGNRFVHPNEAVVLNITLVDVDPVAEGDAAAEKGLSPMPMKKKEGPVAGKANIVPMQVEKKDK